MTMWNDPDHGDLKLPKHSPTERELLQRVFDYLMSLQDGDAPRLADEVKAALSQPVAQEPVSLTFDAFRKANVTRCIKWHPQGIESWSASDWLTAITGELGELASLLKMRNRERDGLPGNKFSPTDKQVADEIADVLTYLDLLAAMLGVDLGQAAANKFNEVSERVGFPDRIPLYRHPPQPAPAKQERCPDCNSNEREKRGGC
jgi:NTP pyrophosphatase (non-canonical NTP hydrolase)